MKTFGLVLAMMGVLSCAACADTATLDIYSQFNLIATPLVPFQPDPMQIFSGTGLDYYSSTLTRFDSSGQQMIGFDPYTPEEFGNVLLGDGYWFLADQPYTIQVTGVPDGVPDGAGVKTDMWISLPGNQTDGVDAGGWNLIGNPFNHDVPFGSDEWGGVGDYIKVTDGTTLKTLQEAEAAEWISGTWTFFDAANQQMLTAGYFYCDDYYLRPGKGYWVETKKDNLALIIPADVM